MANRRTHCLVEANKHGSTLLVDPAGEKNRFFYQCLASFILVRQAKRATALVSRRLGASPLDARTRMQTARILLNKTGFIIFQLCTVPSSYFYKIYN